MTSPLSRRRPCAHVASSERLLLARLRREHLAVAVRPSLLPAVAAGIRAAPRGRARRALALAASVVFSFAAGLRTGRAVEPAASGPDRSAVVVPTTRAVARPTSPRPWRHVLAPVAEAPAPTSGRPTSPWVELAAGRAGDAPAVRVHDGVLRPPAPPPRAPSHGAPP